MLGPSRVENPEFVPLLAATSTGGVWHITDSLTRPVSDAWNNADCECLSHGPLAPSHYLVGGRNFLRHTAPNSSDPLAVWRPVQLPADDPVTMIVSFDQPPRVVIELGTSLWWGDPSIPGFAWRRARDEQGDQPALFGLAIASPTYLGFPWRHAIASFDLDSRELVFGVFENSELVVHPATLASDVDPTSLRSATPRLESCASNRRRVYAYFGEGELLLRSADGGVSWERAALEIGASGEKFSSFIRAGADAPGGSPRKIGVSPTDEMVVAVGMTVPVVSGDSGDSFAPLGGIVDASGHYSGTTPHLHADVNALRFDPFDPSGRRLFLATDGGISMVSDWTAYGVGWRSDYNRNLTNLEFAGCGGGDESESQFQFWSTLGTAFVAPDKASRIENIRTQLIVSGGLQDNGDIAAQLHPQNLEPWHPLQGGDGGYTDFLGLEHFRGAEIDGTPADEIGAMILHNSHGGQRGHRVNHTTWDYASYTARGPIPLPGSEGLAGATRVAAVDRPHVVNEECICAVAGNTPDDDRPEVYVLAIERNGDLKWRRLWRSASRGSVTAVASYDGLMIYVGIEETTLFGSPRGQILVLDTAQAFAGNNPVFETLVHDAGEGIVRRFAAWGSGDPFAYAIWGQSTLLHFVLDWRPLPAPTNDTFRGVAIDPRDSDRLFLAGERQVYMSPDRGQRWTVASAGLPLAVHCRDIRVAEDPATGRRWALMGTFGRSVWRAEIDPPDH